MVPREMSRHSFRIAEEKFTHAEHSQKKAIKLGRKLCFLSSEKLGCTIAHPSLLILLSDTGTTPLISFEVFAGYQEGTVWHRDALVLFTGCDSDSYFCGYRTSKGQETGSVGSVCGPCPPQKCMLLNHQTRFTELREGCALCSLLFFALCSSQPPSLTL